MMISDVFAVVLAGGYGTRLWPLSRRNRPKQFIDITDEGTPIRIIVKRLREIIPLKRILVVTLPEQVPQVLQQVPELPSENVLIEPIKRGTGPCIGLAAFYIQSLSANATMLVVPSDQIVFPFGAHLSALTTACTVAKRGQELVTIGLRPTFPSTKYGYIELGPPFREKQYPNEVFQVSRFIEKPDINSARTYFKSGNWVWNTGTFAWSVSTFMAALKRYAPDLFEGLTTAARSRLANDGYKTEARRVYESLRNISIDYALIEHAHNIAVVLGQFERVDLGDLKSLGQLWPKDEQDNVVHGTMVQTCSSGNVVYSPAHLTALIGVENMNVIVTNDVVLVCHKSQSKKLRALLKDIESSELEQYL